MLVSKRMDNRGRKPKLKTQKIIDNLTIFYNKYYKPLINENDIVKNINVNIAEHYIQYVKRFINSYFDLGSKIKKINFDKNFNKDEKKEKIKELNIIYNKVKDDILNPLDIFKMKYTSDKEFYFLDQ